ncbi:MAG: M50 family metallopeptidase [Saprospiraceae bacterium]
MVAEERIIAIDGKHLEWNGEIRNYIKSNPDKTISIEVVNQDNDTLTKSATLGADGVLGVFSYGADHYFDFKTQKYSFAQSIPMGIKTSWNFITGQVKAFGKIFQGKIPFKDSVGSVVSMGKLFGPTWDTQRFWTMTAMLSLLLAFLNLLPIPGLDGGHAVFAIYEMVTGRKPSDKVVEIATTIGFILLVILMVLALGNDIRKLF